MIRIFIVLTILGIFNSYVFLRLTQRMPWAQDHLLLFTAIGFGVFVLQLLGPFGDRLISSAFKSRPGMTQVFRLMDWVSYGVLGIMSLLLIYTLALDVVTMIWKLVAMPTDLINFDRRSLLTLGLFTAGTAALGVGQAIAGPTVHEVAIPLVGLPASFDGFRIAQVSDLHVGPTIGRAYTQNVVDIVNNLKPDLIALTGDFVDGSIANLRDEVAPLTQLTAPHGKFYITGNHEYYWGADAWATEFTRMGMRVLANQHEVIRHNGGAILMAGVTDYSTLKSGRTDATNPSKALDGAPPNLVKILLAHQPATYQLAHEAGFDLQLSGHTHSGQYFPFNLMIRFFQKYYKGLNRHENMWVYVNRGTGYWGPPLRTCVPSEITLITLKAA
jgi:predicted MPP superfamily phosphohydrolase